MDKMHIDYSKFNKRQESIITFLLEKERLLTSEQLASALGVSQRTVKEDIKSIKAVEEKIGIQIRSHRSQGYSAIIKDDYLLHCYNNREKLIDLNTQNDRILILIQYLLIQKDYVFLNDLADLLAVSLSTLNNDLKLVKNMLAEEEISIISRPNKGIKVDGSERRIRSTLSKYINLDLSSIEAYNRLFKDSTFTYSDMKILADYFVGIFRDYYHNLIGIGITNLLIHIIIIINRNKAGFRIEHLESEKLPNREEYQLALNIAQFLEEKFSLVLPEKEIQYLSFCLLNNGVISVESDSVDDFLETVSIDLRETFNVCWDNQHDEYNALYLHTLGILERLKYGLNVDGRDIIEMIRNRFVLAYEMAMIYKKDFESVFRHNMDDVEVCYVAVHFGAILERQKLQRNLPRLIIITETRTGKALLLKNELLAQFATLVNIVGIYSPYEMKQINFSEIGFILSTENLGEAFPKRYLKIPFNLNSAVLRSIKAYLCNQKIIDKIFKKELFLKNCPFTNAKEFLFNSAIKFKNLNFIQNEQEFYHLTCKREEMQSTRFDYILAMPHPLQAISQENFISVAIFDEGLQWLNGGSVKLILYIGFTGKNREEITGIFDILSLISNNHSLIDDLIKVKSFEEFIATLKLCLNVLEQRK